MPIYFIRHGQSEFNASFNAGLGDPEIIDAPLTELGFQQAEVARETVADLGISHVITSPLTRAIQTARHIFHDGPAIEVWDDHRELVSHTCDIGRSPVDLVRDFPDLDFGHLKEKWWYQPGSTSFELEPADLFRGRIADFVTKLETVEKRPVAIIGHGNAFFEIIGHMLQNCEIHRYR